MRLTMDLFLVICYLIFLRLGSAKLAVKMSNKKISKTTTVVTTKPVVFPLLLQFKSGKVGHPDPLPTPPSKAYIMSPYTTLYQGLRYKNDTRVFRKKFDYEAKISGQQIVCQGLFDCIISHIAIESSEAIPVLLKGGAGYRHFTAVIKAKPHKDLRGQVRAYCRSHYVPLQDEQLKLPMARRRFFFGDRLAEENWT